MARRLAVAASAALAAAAGLVLAQPAARPTLHEKLPDPASDHPSPTVADPRGGNPAALAAGDKVIPKPSLDAPPAGSHDEPVLGRGGFGADRFTQMKADEKTGPDGTLSYVSVFNPDVLPFKRMSAFDKIYEDETLHVASTALVEQPVGGTTNAKTRDRFYGDVLVELKPGIDVPLPSVAPDMRILSYEMKPKLAVRFSRDSADNFYVRSDEPNASGTYRLVFYADADAGYFAPATPTHAYKVRDVKAHASAELREMLVLPPKVAALARHTLNDRIHIDQDFDLPAAFNQLVGYFRSFEAGEIKNPTGDTYRDLCDSKTGVCRHRSFAFMITANQLGIPTRMVENEAHAFVEVWFPERGWQRIDLGGAALKLDVTNANDKTLHRPRAEDPFAKPVEYNKRGSYTKLEGEIRGLSDRQLADKHRSLDQAPASGTVGDGGGNGGGNGSGGASNDRISPQNTLPALPPDPKKQTPMLAISRADTSAYRGTLLHVEGWVRVDRKPVANHTVHIWLMPPGGHESGIELGVITTRDDGNFSAEVPVRGEAQLQSYELMLTSDPDAYYNAAKSD